MSKSKLDCDKESEGCTYEVTQLKEELVEAKHDNEQNQFIINTMKAEILLKIVIYFHLKFDLICMY